MHTSKPPPSGFKRQVVFRIGPDDWPLLEQAAAEHGSIQAAVLAGLRALEATRSTARELGEGGSPHEEPSQGAAEDAPAATDKEIPPAADEEIRAREAAQILGLKSSTIAGYIRSGRLPGRYDETPGRMGWVTSRAAVKEYKLRVR